jgi:flagellar basal body-associated protein FliL
MTTAQPDDAAPNSRPERHSNSTAHHEALKSRRDSTPTGTEEPLWVLVSIVLVLVAVAGMFVYLVHVSRGEAAKPGRNRADGPNSGPGGWL